MAGLVARRVAARRAINSRAALRGPIDELVITNAVYFKGQWQHEFDPKLTTPAEFHRRAADQFERALELLRAVTLPPEMAETQVRAGVALAAAGNRARSVERLVTAYHTARHLGARPLAAVAIAQLEALGEHVERSSTRAVPQSPQHDPRSVVRFGELAVAKLGMVFVQRALALGVIAVRREAHGLALAIAVPPPERLGDVAVEPADGRFAPPLLQQLDFAVLTAPDRARDAVADAVNRDDELLLAGRGARVISRRRVSEVMIDVNDGRGFLGGEMLEVKRRLLADPRGADRNGLCAESAGRGGDGAGNGSRQ